MGKHFDRIAGRLYVGLAGLVIGLVIPASLVITGLPLAEGWGLFPATTTMAGYVIGWRFDWPYM